MAREKVVLCWSGGKDSALALHRLQRDENCEVVALLTRATAKVADNVVCRTSSNNLLADMPDMSRGFVQGGTTPEEVIVTFTGTWPKPSSGTPAGAFILLEIDGGVKVDNIAAIAAAGAGTFVAGSAIFGARDYRATIGSMRAALASGAQ